MHAPLNFFVTTSATLHPSNKELQWLPTYP
jgi:hypothetical protein